MPTVLRQQKCRQQWGRKYRSVRCVLFHFERKIAKSREESARALTSTRIQLSFSQENVLCVKSQVRRLYLILAAAINETQQPMTKIRHHPHVGEVSSAALSLFLTAVPCVGKGFSAPTRAEHNDRLCVSLQSKRYGMWPNRPCDADFSTRVLVLLLLNTAKN